MSDFGFNVYGAVASAIGIIFAIYPAFRAWVRPRLPTSLLPEILVMHKETQEMFATALQKGFLPQNPWELFLFNRNMVTVNTRVDEIRAQVYAIKSWREDVGMWWGGLSDIIAVFRKELNSFRLELAERNTHEGMKLVEELASTTEAGNRGSDLSAPPGAPPGLPQDSDYYRRVIAMSHGITLDSRYCEHDSVPGSCAPCQWPGASHKTEPSGIPAVPGESPLPDKVERSLACPSAGESSDAPSRANLARSTDGQTRDLALKATLDSLLSLALSRPRRWAHRRSKRGQHTRDSPVKSDKQHRGEQPGRSSADSGGKAAKRDALHARLQVLEHLVRRLYGLHTGPRTADLSSKGDIVLDPESLMPMGVEDDDSSGDSDEWEEECQ
ncbi:hypothetical protein FKP32DRAFT_1587197 [Trametes sanguinea]|nr:hypothetical protein FKP32DRAFT_1587197 [Trametes sanguinea]